MAASGVCSRREADRLIEAGRVRINGVIVQELGTKIDDRKDVVVVDGKTVKPKDRNPVYILLHKPKGVVVSVKDPFGRKTVMDYLGGLGTRVFPVGRLDADSSGALLLTDDGELAHRLMHPRFGVTKIYEVEVEGEPGGAEVELLARGVFIDGRKTAPAAVAMVFRSRKRSVLRIEMREGRKREVRRMFEAVGFPVTRLVRTEFGGLRLSGLKPGAWRLLSAREVERLKKKTFGPSA